MPTRSCERFAVRCDSIGLPCEACVLRSLALARAAKRARVEARRRERALEGRGVPSVTQLRVSQPGGATR